MLHIRSTHPISYVFRVSESYSLFLFFSSWSVLRRRMRLLDVLWMHSVGRVNSFDSALWPRLVHCVSNTNTSCYLSIHDRPTWVSLSLSHFNAFHFALYSILLCFVRSRNNKLNSGLSMSSDYDGAKKSAQNESCWCAISDTNQLCHFITILAMMKIPKRMCILWQ